MPQKIYKITDRDSGVEYYYTSITAALTDVDNPIDITNRRWSQIVKEKGYPFEHSGCKIEQIFALTGEDVRENNPPVVD